jgi:DhnA family fructose-bisphosphate aldolase class Ia
MELNSNFVVPCDVPENKRSLFIKNYNAITRDIGRLFLFSCDHKIEHLNRDFYGSDINPQALHPEHMFRIAYGGDVGAMATHLGLIARYAKQYSTINYIIKMNATTHIDYAHQQDLQSLLLCSIDEIITFKNNNNSLKIAGIGITIYLGNQYESQLISQAAHVINKAHQEGLVTITWIYMRGKNIIQENNPELIAGAAGLGVSLGTDFIKIKAPAKTETITSSESLKIACAAAGNSKIICAGGEKTDYETYLKNLYDQIHSGDTAGTATGRNIFQLSLPEAIALTHAISAIVYKNTDYKTGLAAYHAALEKNSL